jgi:hypothetical protein
MEDLIFHLSFVREIRIIYVSETTNTLVVGSRSITYGMRRFIKCSFAR